MKQTSNVNDALVSRLIQVGVLSSADLIHAFLEADRENFVLPEHRDKAHEDIALPIGWGQTISQPRTVAIMLEWLEPRPGEKILDVGAGSGWTAVLFSVLVGKEGRVYGTERIPELVLFGKKNIEKYNKTNIEIVGAGRKLGLVELAPFDKILVSAAATNIPSTLVAQLKEGGTMVLPVGNSLKRVRKTGGGELKIETLENFVFVPLITELMA